MSLPDDVAEYLDKHPNSSAVITAAVRARMERGAAVAAALRAAGVNLTEAGIAAARGNVPPLTKAQRAEAKRYQEALEAGHLPEATR